MTAFPAVAGTRLASASVRRRAACNQFCGTSPLLAFMASIDIAPIRMRGMMQSTLDVRVAARCRGVLIAAAFVLM